MKKIENIGVMFDCSRNAVLNLVSVKKMIDIMSKMGYKILMLYTEDTYEVDNEPLFGYLRGRYSKEEMKEIDSYAIEKGIEVIPCIQTLAHLNQMFKWGSYAPINDIDDILLIGDDRTYSLIENMLKTIKECFSSKRIHLGMDEAFKVGFGKYMDLNGFKDRKEILLPHLERVVKMAVEMGFEPMIWSDMFYRLAAGCFDYYKKDVVVSDEIRGKVPKELTLVYWDYYHKDKETYDNLIKGHKGFDNPVYFGGGIWTWSGFSPQNEYAFKVTEPAIKACLENDIDTAFATAWKDNGAECSTYASLPAMFYFKECANSIFDMEKIKRDFYDELGVPFDCFLTFDMLNRVENKEKSENLGDFITNSSKYMLYSDPFFGFLDSTVSMEDGEHFKKVAAKIRREKKKMGEFSYLSDYYYDLSRVLEYKYTLGLKTRALYNSNDMDGLGELVKDYKTTARLLKKFLQSFRTVWFKENKPHGFEVQEIRIGGLIQRVESCGNRLNDYVKGSIDRIEELEEDIRDFSTGGKSPSKKLECVNDYIYSSTVNKL